jgi:Uma2 family endonuclease
MEYRIDSGRRWTVKEAWSLPSDGNRYEVVHGELLVTPAPNPRHQTLITRLMQVLIPYLAPLGYRDALFVGPADFFHSTDVYLQPDILVCRPEEVSADWRTVRRLVLAVEVVSPSSRHFDRGAKRRAYQAAGTATLWIVDPATSTVEIWTPEATVPVACRDTLKWRVRIGADELVVDVARLLRELPGEVQS